MWQPIDAYLVLDNEKPFSIGAYRNQLRSILKLLPDKVCRHWPLVVSHTLTVESALPETSIFCCNSMPDVRLWWPISVCLHVPVAASHTRIDVSSDPDTTWTPSNWREKNGELRLFGLDQIWEIQFYLQWIDAVCVADQGVQAFFCLWIPNFDTVIIGTGNNELAIVLHTAHGRQVTDQCVQTSAMNNIPNTKCGIAWSTDDPIRIQKKSKC